VDYGVPAAGVLCVELLHATRHPHALDIVIFSRPDTIHSLSLYVTFLDWVRPNDGNYELCRKLKQVIRNILDHCITAPTFPKVMDGVERRIPDEDTPGDAGWDTLSETEWLGWLNTVDWTQGFGGDAFPYSGS